MTVSSALPWAAVIEGFYGPAYTHAQRLALLRWLPTVGFTDYAYGPKDDAFHRESWRETYPERELGQLAETAEVAREVGVTLTLAVSPGLDWQGEADHDALVAKLRQLYDLGVRSLGVYWDDVQPGGASLGLAHGEGVAAAVAGLPEDVRWMTCGTDYATAEVTPYLAAFAAALPAGIPIAWTGPDITSPSVPAQLAQELTEALGHPLLLCDNWPVNDLGCASQLHLGPAPYREPALRGAVAGIGFNAMGLPLASRTALELGLRHWNDPEEDRETAWAEVVGGVPGLGPIARACRSWVDQPGPDAELVSWLGDDRLLEFLDAGCRVGLDPLVQAELEPWLASWEAEARVMTWVLRTLRGEAPEGELNLGVDWLALHRREAQVFGTRLALYGLSFRLDHRLLPHPAGAIRGENLTDLLIRQSLEGLLAQVR